MDRLLSCLHDYSNALIRDREGFSPPTTLRAVRADRREGKREAFPIPTGVKYLNSKSNLRFDLMNCIF